MKDASGFSLTLVKKIMRVLLEKGEMPRTDLSKAANMHYSRLLEQLSLLEERQYTEEVIREGKIVVRTTEKGREFGRRLLDLE
jgi:predicted transcriptional regulator